MKTMAEHINEVMAVIETASHFDDITIKSIVGMLIDTCAAKNGENAVDIAQEICEIVKLVNADLGAYHL